LPARPCGAAPAGYLWLCAEAISVANLGDEVALDPLTDFQLDASTAVALRRGTWVKWELVRVLDAGGFVEKIRGRYRDGDREERDRKDLRERLRQPPLEKEAPKHVPAAPSEEGDARTLWVDYDDQGVRFKPWKQVVSESQVEEYQDFPLDGPPTLHHLAKHMERNGGDPRLWLQIWIREKKLDANDRAVHEMKSLVDMIYYGGTYDQFNLGGAVALEVAARRLQLIVDAYSNPSRPNWENAKLFSGQASPEDCISPTFRAWMARRSKEEADVHLVRQRAREVRGVGGGGSGRGDTTEVVESGGLPNNEAEGGRAAGGRRGRGRGVPSAEKK